MRQTDIDPDDLRRPDWNSLLENYSLHDVGEAYFTGRAHQMGLSVEEWGIDQRHNDDGLIFDNKMDLRLWEPLDGKRHPDAWQNLTDEAMEYEEYATDEEFGTPLSGVNNGDVDKMPIGETNTWQLRGVADIKTKSNSDWMGKFNLRHLTHYAEHAAHYVPKGVPVFLYFTMVDRDVEQVGDNSFVAPVTHEWDWESLVDHYDRETDTNLTYGELKDVARGCDIVKRTFRAPDGNLVVNIEDEYKYNNDWIVENVL